MCGPQLFTTIACNIRSLKMCCVFAFGNHHISVMTLTSDVPLREVSGVGDWWRHGWSSDRTHRAKRITESDVV